VKECIHYSALYKNNVSKGACVCSELFALEEKGKGNQDESDLEGRRRAL